MNDSVLYELVVEKNHIDLMIKALSNYMCAQYEGIDLEIVDVPVTLENIKVASDMQLVLKHRLGLTRHNPKQTSATTSLIWCRDIDLDEYCNQDMFDQFNDERLQQAWSKVKERHSDTIKQIGDM
jgi:hypothetical protein